MSSPTMPTPDEWRQFRELWRLLPSVGTPRRAAVYWLGVECLARIRHLLIPDAVQLADVIEAHAEGHVDRAAVLTAAQTFQTAHIDGAEFANSNSAAHAAAFLVIGDLIDPNNEQFQCTSRQVHLVGGMAYHCCYAVSETIPDFSWREEPLPPDLDEARVEYFALSHDERRQISANPEINPRLHAVIRGLDATRAQREAQQSALWAAEELAQCDLVREIIQPPFVTEFSQEFRTSTVRALARDIYEKRAFDQMPILADALQDAGCNDEHILSHCRSTSATHVRGCWVVDLVLDKE